MKHLLLTLALFLGSHLLSAQNFLSIQPSNYSGILGANLQPASLADSRHRIDLNLFGFSGTLDNNYLGFSKTFINDALSLGEIPPVDSLSKPLYFPETLNGEDKSLYLNYDNYGPSLMLAISPKRSIGFTTRQRNFFNLDYVGEELARLAYADVRLRDLWRQPFNSDGLSLDYLSYWEVGLVYSQVVLDQGKHFLKAGARLKWINGMASVHLQMDRLEYDFPNQRVVNIREAEARYAHSTNLSQTSVSTGPFPAFENVFSGNNGWGGDLGLVYEFRPQYQEYTYRLRDTLMPRKDLNKYRLRLGVSLLDVGSVRFDRAESSRDFTGQIRNFAFRELNQGSFQYADSVLDANFDLQPSITRYSVTLPTAFSLQADLRITRNLYFNITPHIAFKREGRAFQVHELSNISFTPRWESRFFDLALPVSYTEYGDWALGTGVRVGPVMVGSRNILSVLTQENTQGLDFHVSVRLALGHPKLKDKDKDGIPDDEDPCPRRAGTLANNGCPEGYTPPELVENEEPGIEEQMIEEGDEIVAEDPPVVEEPVEEIVNEEPPAVEEPVEEIVEVEAPAVEEPLEEIVEVEAPAVEEPEEEIVEVEAPAVEEPVEEIVEVEAPAVEEPVEEIVEVEAPAVEEPVEEIVEVEAPAVEEPVEEIVEVEAPAVEEPVEEIVEVEPPAVEEPVEEIVEVEPPAVEEPVEELVEIEAPAVEEPVEEIVEVAPPVVEEPVEEIVEVEPPAVEEPEEEIVEVAPPVVEEEEATEPLPTEPPPSIYSVGEIARYLPYADVDQDGVVNKDDKCPEEAGSPDNFGCPPGDPRGLPAEPDPTWDRLYFETNETYLPGKSRVVLNNALRFLRANPNAKLLILGHADSQGSNPYNDNLSRRRCDAAKAYLLSQGMDESRLIIEYYGETQPAANNISEEGRQQNRRVELRMIE